MRMLTSLADRPVRYEFDRPGVILYCFDRLMQLYRQSSGGRLVHTFRHRVGPIALLVAALTLAPTCGSSGSSKASGNTVTLRLGYLPNVTHAPAIVGLQNGTFTKDLGT